MNNDIVSIKYADILYEEALYFFIESGIKVPTDKLNDLKDKFGKATHDIKYNFDKKRFNDNIKLRKDLKNAKHKFNVDRYNNNIKLRQDIKAAKDTTQKVADNVKKVGTTVATGAKTTGEAIANTAKGVGTGVKKTVDTTKKVHNFVHDPRKMGAAAALAGAGIIGTTLGVNYLKQRARGKAEAENEKDKSYNSEIGRYYGQKEVKRLEGIDKAKEAKRLAKQKKLEQQQKKNKI